MTTGLSGNEIFCLHLKKYTPGPIVVGNSVHALGMLGSFGSSFKAMLGGEMQQITSLIEEGRETAYKRMQQEAAKHNASGITGVSSQLIIHATNIEFLSIGSCIYSEIDKVENTTPFSSTADGQELFAQLDAGYKPICFAFGNVAYSIGLGRGLLGGLKTLGRGEIKEYSDIFNKTRHLALDRIITHARQNQANAVLGIRTTILPLMTLNEMLMMGTASHHPELVAHHDIDVITSDMTNLEMWNMTRLGYTPLKLLLGTSVYSLGLVGNIKASLKSFVRGELNELTQLLYDARENALAIINDEAKSIGADDVVGVKTYVYQLGNGLIEFLAIGTAVKKATYAKTQSEQLPPQAIIVDQDTFYNANDPVGFNITLNQGGKPMNRSQPAMLAGVIVYIVFLFLFFMFKGF